MERLVLFSPKIMPRATPPHGNVKNCRLTWSVSILLRLYLFFLTARRRLPASTRDAGVNRCSVVSSASQQTSFVTEAVATTAGKRTVYFL